MITGIQALQASIKVRRQMEDLGMTPPVHVQVRVSGRMSRAFGNCAMRRQFGSVVEITISINKDIPESSLLNTMAHEYIHACLPFDENHGARFHAAARKVNQAYGYHIETTASKDETKILNQSQIENGKRAGCTCAKCGAVIAISTRTNAYKKIRAGYTGYKHTGCGGVITLK